MASGAPTRWLTGPMISRFSAGALAAWYLSSLLCVLLLPAMGRLRLPPWALAPELRLQVWVWGAVFAALAVLALRHRRGMRLTAALAMAGAAWALGYAVLTTAGGVPVSRVIAAASATLGTLMLVLPWLLPSRLAAAAPLLATAGVVAGLLAERAPRPGQLQDATLITTLVPLAVDYQYDLLPVVENRGGAIARLGPGYLVVDAIGNFHRLAWDSTGTRLVASPVPLSPPLNRDEYLADQPASLPLMHFRVTDLLVDTSAGRPRIYVAHQHWNRADRCLTLRVSTAVLGEGDDPPPWDLVYETRPCVVRGATIHFNQTGGQLAWHPSGQLLLTVGDHGHDGITGGPWAQDSAVDYGKILLLDLAGGARHLTMGHRNPQGLLVDPEGRIWSAEQGPRGGDEINLIEAGRNYGWPLATYGTEYQGMNWPLTEGRRDHAGYQEPAHVFVPSLAISSLTLVGPGRFGPWDGDFLLGSLRSGTLVRIRTRGAEVAYAEPMPIGLRIRDLTQGSDGRIVLWTDAGTLVVLDTAGGTSAAGALAYAQCSGCHGADREGSALAPGLRGLLGRPVASQVGFEYSQGLRRLGGRWTADRLDRFLRDPAAVAPGTAMVTPGIADEARRRALIEYLRSG